MKLVLKKKKTAFSLIELSIVILIISILITGSLSISKTNIANNKKKITKEKIDAAYKTITTFVAINRRLPCPALFTVVKGSSTYGDETATGGTCTGLTTSGNLVYGMLPTKALGLEPNMAEDGFGTKISYIVDSRFTKRSFDINSTDGFEMTQSIAAPDDIRQINGGVNDFSIIKIQSPSGTDITDSAVLVLISHGANKYSGWNATSTAQNGDDGIADENSNSITSYDATFIAYSTDANFDDIILFKTKPQITRDAGMEFIMCNKEEAEYHDGNNDYNHIFTSGANYSNTKQSRCSPANGSNSYISKTCGRYGTWGNWQDYANCP